MLIEHGRGLTQSGDDLLAGFLAAMRLLGGDATFANDCAARITVRARHRTMALSATLLRLAAAGQICAEMAGLLRALAGGLPPLSPRSPGCLPSATPRCRSDPRGLHRRLRGARRLGRVLSIL